jgi:hypothetical protein
MISTNVESSGKRGDKPMLFRIIQLIPKELVVYVDANDINGAILEAAKVFAVSNESICNPEIFTIRPVGGEDLPFV